MRSVSQIGYVVFALLGAAGFSLHSTAIKTTCKYFSDNHLGIMRLHSIRHFAA
jgi:hypothetical protein